ncbi:MAG: STAS domain-containing protein [Bacteroidales bacterium]|nr:STAS domain-containing protein [Bacteroidales bacterium]
MIEVTEKNGILIARFKNGDRFNALITEPVKEILLSHLSKKGTKLILNLEGIKFVDSSGFGVFLAAMKAAQNNMGEFRICNLTSEVKELFHVLQLHTIFDIQDNLSDCLSSFNTGK